MLSVSLAQGAAVQRAIGASGVSEGASPAVGMTRKFLLNNIECREQDIEQDASACEGVDLGGRGEADTGTGPGFLGGDIDELESFCERCHG